jgi:peptide/nickel transport system permease protein
VIRGLLRWLTANRSARIGTALTGLMLLIGALAPLLAPNDPFANSPRTFVPPSLAFWMGSDDLGRDLYSGVIHGIRTSLLIGIGVAAATFLIGTSIGMLAGYFGGWVDDTLMRFTELVHVLPRFFLALIVVALFGSKLAVLIAVLALTSWTFTARLARAATLTLRGQEFVGAARALGAPDLHILAAHLLPNVLAPILVTTAGQIGRAILTEAGLAFVGLGDPSVMSLGYLLNNAQRFMRLGWWLSFFPGVAVALISVSVNLLADGLNARLKSRH